MAIEARAIVRAFRLLRPRPEASERVSRKTKRRGRILPTNAVAPTVRRLADAVELCSCSSAGLERLTVDQEVGGSNPPTCTRTPSTASLVPRLQEKSPKITSANILGNA